MVEDEISRELASFRDNEPLYQSIKDEIDSFSEVLGQKGIRHIWESRVKTQASLEGKLRKHLKDGKNGINGIADLVGGRIVLLKIKDLETVTDLIKENFQLEEDPIQHPTSKEHASQLGQRFRGYDGLHFRFRLKEEHKSEVIVEIQVVHVIMWIYYEVEHDLGYKGGQNSEELDRVLGMLKGAANLNAEAFAQFEEVFGNQKLKGGRIEVMNPVTQSTEASSEKPIVATQIRILLETQDMLRNILQDESRGTSLRILRRGIDIFQRMSVKPCSTGSPRCNLSNIIKLWEKTSWIDQGSGCFITPVSKIGGRIKSRLYCGCMEFVSTVALLIRDYISNSL